MSDSSPYKDFNGTFASGTTWDTYIEWVRVEMFKALEKDKTFEVEVDDDNDPDEMPSISLEDAEEEAEETDADTTVDENEEVPYDWMFKGFIAFALWGHIPIPGGEKYKSGVICAVAGETKKFAGCTRKDSMKRKIENTNIDRVPNRRGVKDVSDGIDKQLAKLLFRGRLETQRQKTFQGKVDQLEYQINYEERKMLDIKDEMGMLDKHNVEELNQLKKQWRDCKDEKKRLMTYGILLHQLKT